MQIFGKEIKPESVTMWLNISGFLTSIVFYLSMGHNMGLPAKSPHNPLQDTLIHVNAKLITEMQLLKAQQDSLITELQLHRQKLSTEQKQVSKARSQLLTTLNSDWDNLPKHEQDNYVNYLLQKLKKQNK